MILHPSASNAQQPMKQVKQSEEMLKTGRFIYFNVSFILAWHVVFTMFNVDTKLYYKIIITLLVFSYKYRDALQWL